MGIADHIDLVDLLARDGVTLRRVGNTWRGACPLHGGRNETTFDVWQTPSGAWRWRCWAGCNDARAGDAIDYARLAHGVGFRAACELLGIDPDDAAAALTPRAPAPPPDAEPPPDAWRGAMVAVSRNAALTLRGVPGRRALAYLRQRGLADETITRAGLGWTPGASIPGAAIPSGIVIPHWAKGKLWRVTVRRLAGDEPKYVTVSKSGNAPFLLDEITTSKPVALVEGAFDALALWQEARDLVTPVAVGATGCRLVRWLALLARAPALILAFDADPAGDAAAAWWQSAFPNARRWRPVAAKDAADMLATPGLARAWIAAALEEA